MAEDKTKKSAASQNAAEACKSDIPHEPTLKERVGENLKAIRIKKHLKQAELADWLNVSPAYLSAVERGVSGISIEILDQLCRRLNTSADCFLYGHKETADEEVERLNVTIQMQNGIIRALMRGREPLDVLGALVGEVGLSRDDIAALMGGKSAPDDDRSG